MPRIRKSKEFIRNYIANGGEITENIDITVEVLSQPRKSSLVGRLAGAFQKLTKSQAASPVRAENFLPPPIQENPLSGFTYSATPTIKSENAETIDISKYKSKNPHQYLAQQFMERQINQLRRRR
jgi:hypothetical protein